MHLVSSRTRRRTTATPERCWALPRIKPSASQQLIRALSCKRILPCHHPYNRKYCVHINISPLQILHSNWFKTGTVSIFCLKPSSLRLPGMPPNSAPLHLCISPLPSTLDHPSFILQPRWRSCVLTTPAPIFPSLYREGSNLWPYN